MSLAQAMVRNRGNHEIVLALNGLFPETIAPIRVVFDGLLPRENIRVWHALAPVRENGPGNEWRRTVAELIREAFLATLKPDVIVQFSLFEGYTDDAVTGTVTGAPNIPTAVLLYDFIPLMNAELYLKPVPSYEKHYLRKIELMKKADAWLAISESAAREGRDLLGLDPEFVTVVTMACDSAFQKVSVAPHDKEQLLKRLGVTRPFILYTGDADDRKNLPRLIRAYAQLPSALRSNHQLVFAGKMRDANVRQLKLEAKAAGLKVDELCIPGYVSDAELVQLYNICKLFVFPSWHEGFGLPPLEAMACGAAVIGANASSIPEVIGRADALFNPYEVSEISAKMAQALENENFRRELADFGLEQAKKFSWDASARVAVTALEELYRARSCPLHADCGDTLLNNLISKVTKEIPADISETKLLTIAHGINCIKTGPQPWQLFVDISELVQRDSKTGIQRVTRNILRKMLAYPPEGFVVEPVYATTDRIGYRHARSFMAQFSGAPCLGEDVPIDYRAGDIFLGLDLQFEVVPAQATYLKSIWNDGVKVVFLVYDLLPISFPQYFESVICEAHKKWLLTLAEFDGAVCISKAVADELKIWLEVNTPKRVGRFAIGWYHNGADLDAVQSTGEILPDDAAQVLAELGMRPSFLSVGTIEPRKGQAQILEAFEVLWAEGVQANLVLVGKQGWLVEQFIITLRSHPELGKRLFWLEGISDVYLEKIYAASTCLIAASFGEGFGLPLVEAAQRKLPIIARDIPVFREVAGEHAFYFNASRPEDLSEVIKSWLDLHAKGMTMNSANIPWLTWEQSTAQLLAAILNKC
jgi:glycosyltransferase involved in cell wall biosynthesis